MSVPTTSGFYSMGNLEEYNRKNIEKVIDYMWIEELVQAITKTAINYTLRQDQAPSLHFKTMSAFFLLVHTSKKLLNINEKCFWSRPIYEKLNFPHS